MKNTGAEIHSMAGDFDSAKGDFRKFSVRAGNRLFPDYQKVPDFVNQLCLELNQKLRSTKEKSISEIYDLSFDAHFQLVFIHPFADGNGRTSRLLMNYIQAFYDLPLTLIYTENRLEYFNALEKTKEEENPTIFRQFMQQQLVKFFENELKLLTSKTIKKNKGFTFVF